MFIVAAIFERLRQILHEGGAVSERVQYMIELAHAVRKDGFKNYPSVPTGNNSSNSSSTASTNAMGGPSRQSEQQQQTNSSAIDSTSGSAGVSHSLDLVCEGDQITHLLRLDEVEPTHSQDTLSKCAHSSSLIILSELVDISQSIPKAWLVSFLAPNINWLNSRLNKALANRENKLKKVVIKQNRVKFLILWI